MPICKALLKYGHESFTLEIIEYCSADKCIEREGDYIKTLNPFYNIIKDPVLPPMSGRTHSEKTRKKMRDASKESENSGRFKKGQARPEGAGSPAQKISVFDQDTKLTIIYDSIRAAARVLEINHRCISQYIIKKQNTLYKKRYIFKKV
jgi:hypothetical protein